MTRQEIREGIASIVMGDNPLGLVVSDRVLNYLHSQGVVIKVDRELPNDAIYRPPKQEEAYCEGRDTVIQAGYTAWEPLIKECK